MNEIKKYSYEDWWNGDVVLEEAKLIYYKGAKPNIVNWKDFNGIDASRIKMKQNELFEFEVERMLGEHTDQFEKRYEETKMKEAYLKGEKKVCFSLIKKGIPKKEIIFIKKWNIELEYIFLLNVQNYIERKFENHIEDGKGFIHSPNCIYKDKFEVDYRIYGNFLWNYYNWLKAFPPKNRESGKLTPEPFNKLFKEYYSYELLTNYVKRQTVDLKKNKLSFIKLSFAFRKFIEMNSLKIYKHYEIIDILKESYLSRIVEFKGNLQFKNYSSPNLENLWKELKNAQNKI